MLKWFVCIDEQVSGPYGSLQLQKLSGGGSISGQALVWGHVQEAWISMDQWLIRLPEVLAHHQDQIEERQWHYAYDRESYGPMPRQQLVDQLKSLPRRNEVMLWTAGMATWVPVYEFFDFMDELGLHRRQHPRADIKGRLIVRVGSETHIGMAVTVSAGGLGATGFQNLTPGTEVNLELKDSDLGISLKARAEVRYQGDDQVIGFKFLQLNSETESALVQYVRRANQSLAPQTPQDKAA